MYIYLRSTSNSVGGDENEDNAAPTSSDDCSGVLGLEGGKVSVGGKKDDRKMESIICIHVMCKRTVDKATIDRSNINTGHRLYLRVPVFGKVGDDWWR